MHKFIAIYASAAHLALVSIVPLFLLPFLKANDFVWALFAALPLLLVWLIMEPSVYRGETLHGARSRSLAGMRSDPLTWALVGLAAYLLLAAANGGVSYEYDAEHTEWMISLPYLAYLPGSVTSTGWLPAAQIAALAVAVVALNHAFGSKAGQSLMLLLTLLSGVAAIWWLFLMSHGTSISFDGTLFGFALLLATVATDGAFQMQLGVDLLLVVVAMGGNLAGLVVFAPPLASAVIISLWLLIMLWSLVRRRGRSAFFGGIGYPMIIGSALAIAALLLVALADKIWPLRYATYCSLEFFPKSYAETRAILSECARNAWMHSPWLGSGFGSFALDLRQYLQPSDWPKIPYGTIPDFNGWWQLLAEGGVVRALLVAVPPSVAVIQWLLALVATARRRKLKFEPSAFVGPLALMVFVGLPFYYQHTLTVEALMFTMLLMVFSTRTIVAMTKGDN